MRYKNIILINNIYLLQGIQFLYGKMHFFKLAKLTTLAEHRRVDAPIIIIVNVSGSIGKTVIGQKEDTHKRDKWHRKSKHTFELEKSMYISTYI